MSQCLHMEFIIFPILPALSLQTAIIQMLKGKHLGQISRGSGAELTGERDISQANPAECDWACKQVRNLAKGFFLDLGWMAKPHGWIVQDVCLPEDSTHNKQCANMAILNVLSRSIPPSLPFLLC